MRPRRRPSETSESSVRLLRLFRGHREIDAGSTVSLEGNLHEPIDSPSFTRPSSSRTSCSIYSQPNPAGYSPVASPQTLHRSLPSLPPARPPRPPSLNLDTLEATLFLPTPPSSTGGRSTPRPCPVHQVAHRMPELDKVWEGFMKDVEGDAESPTPRPSPPSAKPTRARRPAHAITDTRSQPHGLYCASGSTPHLPYIARPDKSPRIFSPESDFESSDDEISHPGRKTGFSLSLFPAPPPFTVRRRAPKPLVLLPTPSIAPLPPSPSLSSGDSTPLATPTTPRSAAPSIHSARKSTSPVSILKKTSGQPSPAVFSPALPTSPTTFNASSGWPTESTGSSPRRLRSAQSVPYLQAPPVSNTHRNTASDTTSVTNTRQVTPSDPRRHARKFQKGSPASNDQIEWGYAV
ncbi:hypothetical protein C8J57DRAFT_1498769 [Mycena rebaudengoi]|nr:hypothetical protein C8J57DRAFT_1498769 [Mycena rebaudengoi]